MIFSWLTQLDPQFVGSWQQAVTVAAIVLVLMALVWGRISTDLVMLGGLVIVVAGGVLPAKQAVAGFGNEGLITVAALYVVAGGVRETGALTGITDAILGKPRSAVAA